MAANDRCLVWGEGPALPACLGAATPAPPVPLSSRPEAPGARLLAALLLAAAATAGPASAADGGDGWPAGPGLPPGAPAVDAALGLASVVYPIEVPPGRRGLAPAIALHYSSAVAHGPAGYGFNLVVGSVERSTRLGPPRFDNTDTFVLNLEGQALDLLPIDAASTRFRTVLDSGFLLERVAAGPFGAGSTYWVARGPDGRRYRFGAVAGPEGDSQVRDFKWGLDRVEDGAGNVMTIAWQASGLHLFPARIDYAAHPETGLPATNRVEFCWEGRGDRVRTPSGEVLTHRLHEIRTFAAGEPARSTTLVYDSPGDLVATLGTCRSGWDAGGGSGPGGSAAPEPNPPPAPRGGGRPQMEPEHEAAGPAGWSVRPADAPPWSRATRLAASGATWRLLPAPSMETILGGGAQAAALAPAPEDSIPAPPSPLWPGRSLLTAIRRGDGRGAFLPPLEYVFGADRRPEWPAAGAAGLAPPAPFVYAQDDADEDSGLRIADLNRDGLPDLVQLEGRRSGLAWTTIGSAWLNTGAAYVHSPTWSAALMSLVNPADWGSSAWFVIKRDTRDRVENGVPSSAL